MELSKPGRVPKGRFHQVFEVLVKEIAGQFFGIQGFLPHKGMESETRVALLSDGDAKDIIGAVCWVRRY